MYTYWFISDIGGDAENTSNSNNENAICENFDGSSKCTCKPGFSGDGYNCTGNKFADIDECAQDTHNCSRDNSTCTNTEGLLNCSCDPGFSGDGHNCAGVRIFQSMIAFPFQRVKHTWPDLLVHKKFKSPTLFRFFYDSTFDEPNYDLRLSI